MSKICQPDVMKNFKKKPQKRLVKGIKIFLNNKTKKRKNMVVNVIKIFMSMKSSAS